MRNPQSSRRLYSAGLALAWYFEDRKSTRLNSSHSQISYAVFCLKKKKILADRWMRSTQRGRIFTSAIGMILFLPALVCVGTAGTLSVCVVGLSICGLGWGLFACN